MSASVRALHRLRGERMTTKGRPGLNAEIQAALLATLMDYARGHVVEFPRDVAAELAFAMRDVLAGYTPELFRPRKLRRGESPNTPTQESCIEDAVLYVRYCDAGFIVDRARNKTIREAYNVRDNTVRGWCHGKKYAHITAPAEKPDEHRIAVVRALVNFSGRHYQQITPPR